MRMCRELQDATWTFLWCFLLTHSSAQWLACDGSPFGNFAGGIWLFFRIKIYWFSLEAHLFLSYFSLEKSRAPWYHSLDTEIP